jgi:prevent-host-death family protein
MLKAGIRELKTHLSAYLRRVKAGESILVTERGRTIACIHPVESGKDRLVDRTVLEKLAQQGLVQLPSVAARPVTSRRRNLHRITGKTVAELVTEDRR